MASARTPASTKKGEPTKVRPFCITPTQITAWPPTGSSFSTRPQPSRRSLWERACSRWRPQEPRINKKGEPTKVHPFCITPTQITALPPQVLRSAHDLSHPANPCGSELARDGVRKNPASTKKGEPTKVRPFCITPTQITAWPATTPQASPDPVRTDECLQPVSRSPSHLRWTASGTAIR